MKHWKKKGLMNRENLIWNSFFFFFSSIGKNKLSKINQLWFLFFFLFFFNMANVQGRRAVIFCSRKISLGLTPWSRNYLVSKNKRMKCVIYRMMIYLLTSNSATDERSGVRLQWTEQSLENVNDIAKRICWNWNVKMEGSRSANLINTLYFAPKLSK